MSNVQLKGAGFDMAVDTGKVKYDRIVVKMDGGADFYYKGYHVAFIDTAPMLRGDTVHITGLKGKLKAWVTQA